MTGDDRLDGLVGIILYLIAYAAGIAAHEGWHLVAAQLLGLQPRTFVVGRGPTLVRRRIGRVWLILRAVPLGGIVLMPDWAGRPLARPLLRRRTRGEPRASRPQPDGRLGHLALRC